MTIQQFLATGLVGGILAGAAAQGATMASGYTIGGSSQLLTTNGGAGSVLFNDAGALGGADVSDTVAPFTAAFYSVLLDGSGLWSAGNTVTITGFALPLVDSITNTGTFTFDIREGAGGGGASGTSGLDSLGTADATYTSGSGTSVYYVNFDTPITFVADANSTSIVINWGSTAALRFKKRTEPTGAALPQVNYGNGNFVGGNDTISVSVAGTVVPEPSVALLGGLAGLLVLRRRR